MQSLSVESEKTLEHDLLWRPRPVTAQWLVSQSKARFLILRAGRRSGKTMLAKRKLRDECMDAATNPRPWDDPRFFAAAPTREQAKNIFWLHLKAMIPPYWLDGPPRETELLLRMKWGAEIRVVGLDKPERMEGTPWDGGVIDEIANCKPGTWDAHIRPMLADREGWAWLLGVPDRDSVGQKDYRKLWNRVTDHRDADWEGFSWHSREVLPAAEIHAMESQMDPDLARQELGGEFVAVSGLAFPMFNRTAHIKPAEYDPALPLCWAMDFNVDPMCSGIIQHHKGEVRAIHEIILHDSSTDAACEAFMELVEQRQWNARNVAIYGDPSGHARDSTSGISDWVIVKNRLANYEPLLNVPSGPWPLKDTLNSTRARLRTADGATHMLIDPSCEQLIEDLETLTWPSDLREGHCVAWLRYFAEWEYPLTIETDEPEGRFGVDVHAA